MSERLQAIVERVKKPVAIGVAVLVAAGVGAKVDNLFEGGHSAKAATEEPNKEHENVDGLSISQEHGDLARGKFLPALEDGQVDSETDSEGYVKELFDKDGPLASEINPASLAIADALVLEPTTSKDVDNTQDYRKQFLETLTSLEAGNEKLAEKLSDQAEGHFKTDSRFESDALGKGDQYTAVTPAYGEDQDIKDVVFKHKTTPEAISATVLKLNEDAADRLGFGEIILPGDGRILIPGRLPIPKPSKEKGPNKAPQGVDEEQDKKGPTGTTKTAKGPQGPNQTQQGPSGPKPDQNIGCGGKPTCPGPKPEVPKPSQPAPGPEQPKPEQPKPEQPTPTTPTPTTPTPETPEPTPEPIKGEEPAVACDPKFTPEGC